MRALEAVRPWRSTLDDNKKRDLIAWMRFNRRLMAEHNLYDTGHGPAEALTVRAALPLTFS
jgi:methylglyoxal synthase